MKKMYMLYLLGVGVSVVALAARTSIVYPYYIESIFNLVNMILVASVLLIFFLEEKYKLLMNKFLIMTGFFYLMSWGLNILKNILVVNRFGLEVIQVFLVLFMMCGVGSALLTSVSMHDERLVKKYSLVVISFLPVLVYTAWVILDNPFIVGNIVYRSVSFRIFLLAYVTTYSLITGYLFINRAFKALPLRQKLVMLSAGLMTVMMSDVLREVGLFSPLTCVFSLCGVIIVCMSFIFEPTLKIYNDLFNKMLYPLDIMTAEQFRKELKKQAGKFKYLIIKIDFFIEVVDNPRVLNIIEKRAYDKVLLRMIDWYSRNVENGNKIVKVIKEDYSSQMKLARMTASIFI